MSANEEQLKFMIQTLQEEVKHNQELNNELRMDIDNQTRQQNALSNDNHYLRQKINAMQMDNSNYSNIQTRLETQIYSQDQEIAKLRKEIHQLSKAKRDAEKKLALEQQEFEQDKVNWQQREADLYNQIRSFSVAEPRTPRTPRRRSVTTLSPFGLGDIEETKETTAEIAPTLNAPKLASPSYAREAKIAQRTIKAQDKLISDLKLELDKQKGILQEHQNQVQNQSLKIEHLEHEIANVKQLNRSLMEDNESYQILLHEKTMNGEFMMNPIMQVEDPDMKESSSSSTTSNGLNLAAELNMASDWNQKDQETTIQKLNEEIKILQDTNRALQLYMNKILMKIINNKQLEDVLSIDQPSKEEKTPKPIRAKTTTFAPPPIPTTSQSESVATSRQRRRTISYWGSKTNKTTPSHPAAAEDEKRRHSSIVAPHPERSVSTSTSGTGGSSGWAKALRRMSVIGWTATKETEVDSSEEEPGLDHSRKSHSSCSSTPSIRRSNELGTLAEE
ncbi:hypothetical protein G6F46_009194 [Rhizopus delemar]|uniref:Uncharacterized protein n=2 Tax=Rhizopus TaxID=4842 RepID=A0A9P7CLV0_9FUNG|nr:hypothetical protein G6F43_009576 [Rhizopus delemar]KAG1542045.1 hypothetical protein G6F51_007519 [Rhizopus arrhizus]KAG1450695.1 hypothetical protein G6F55_009563 [Rhizopus delemar]KAG1493348.1 hypothetical protein G6F54_008645 [Rhizopus delemar]KAG1506085.1 hypothetical protein G6F53_009947 [Rhizopus delemar]